MTTLKMALRGADAERQRENRDDGESRRAQQLTDRVARIAHDVGKHQQSSSGCSRSRLRFAEALEPRFDDPFVSRPGVAAVRQPDVLRHPIPVADLPAGVRVGVGLARAAGDRLAIEVLELRGQLADDARLALGGQVGQLEVGADKRLPVAHG